MYNNSWLHEINRPYVLSMLVVIYVYLQNNISIMYLLVVARDKISPKLMLGLINVLTNNISLYRMH